MRHITRELAAWICALALVWALLPFAGFSSRDPDSALHAAFVVQIHQKPVREWIAPVWDGQWRRTGLYREHPAGILVLPAVLARLGYPAEQAAYAANTIYQGLTIVMLVRIGALLARIGEARALSWILLLLPISFTYRIRANHEQAILLMSLFALYATERARIAAWWAWGIAMAAAGVLLIKGVFVLPVLASCAVWAFLRRPRDRAAALRIGAGLVLAAFVAAGVAVAYEYLYRSVTSESFVGFYVGQQIGRSAAPRGAFVPQKLGNFTWYLSRLLWFAFPWSIVLIVSFFRNGARSARHVPTESDRVLLQTVIGSALIWPVILSMFDRGADRYIFPAYFLIGGAGAVVSLREYGAIRRAVDKARRVYPYERVLVWLVLTLLSLLASVIELPRIR